MPWGRGCDDCLSLCLKSFSAHQHPVSTLQFSEDGRQLATFSYGDSTVCVWQVGDYDWMIRCVLWHLHKHAHHTYTYHIQPHTTHTTHTHTCTCTHTTHTPTHTTHTHPTHTPHTHTPHTHPTHTQISSNLLGTLQTPKCSNSWPAAASRASGTGAAAATITIQWTSHKSIILKISGAEFKFFT